MSGVWRKESSEDGTLGASGALAALEDSLGAAQDVVRLRDTETGAVSLLLDWPGVRALPTVEACLEEPLADFKQVALAPADSREEAAGLLRYADLVAVVRAVGEEPAEPPGGLLLCGSLEIQVADGESTQADLFAAAPVDKGSLLAGAPVDVNEPEDLDARADWFKKRHEHDDA